MFKTVSINKINQADSVSIVDVFGYFGNSGGAAFLLDNSSNIWTWGNDTKADRRSASYTPEKIKGGPFSGVTSGFNHISGMQGSNAVTMVDNTYGQLGINNTLTNNYCASPVRVVGPVFTKVYSYGGTTLGLTASSFMYAWGYGSNGQLGNNINASQSSPVSVVGGRLFSSMAGSYKSSSTSTSLGIDNSGYAWTWGNATQGQLGDGIFTTQAASPISVVGGIRWRNIQGNAAGFVGIDISSQLWAWGDSYGIGAGGLVCAAAPTRVASTLRWLDIFPGSSSQCTYALDESSRVWGWGTGLLGGLSTQYSPVLIKELEKLNVAKLASFYNISYGGNSILLTTSNEVYVWGNSAIGAGESGINYSLPTRIRLPPTTKQDIPWPSYSVGNMKLSGSHEYAFLIDASSYLWGWGSGCTGIDPLFGSAYVFPRKLITDRKFLSVVSKNRSCFALDESSAFWAWGNNGTGQLGLGTTTWQTSPKSVPYGPYIKIQTSEGGPSSIGIDASSFVWCWGNFGQGAGNNTAAIQSIPVSVFSSLKFKDIAVGNYFALALDTSGFIWSWGYNNSGQLGDNTVANRSSPVSVLGGRTYLKVYACSSNSYAIDTSSFVWAWGDNLYGQLGNNTTTSKSSPVSVLGGRQFNEIAVNNQYGGAIMYNTVPNVGVAWGIGINNNGQLGDNSVSNRSSPVSVATSLFFKHIENVNTGVLAIPYTAGNSSQIYYWGAAANNVLMDGGKGVAAYYYSSPVMVCDKSGLYETITMPKSLTNIFGK